ncbi:MAG: hypothetical protein QOD93_6018 [Acetobacteraceae bacterium]|jgi:hypothetical protein|nr:hypothetical protein [Rhodopila sp.]MEA2773056.1 hypothetical protein [Acetobacteraceae bacterium]
MKRLPTERMAADETQYWTEPRQCVESNFVGRGRGMLI